MSFLTPVFFWSFLVLIPLGAVYLMRTRPRRRVTNALFLWEKILVENASQVWLRKLRNVLSLLLMALGMILLCLSLTTPRPRDYDPKDLLILIDTSASMQTVETGARARSRLQLAQDQVRSWLRSVEGGTRVALASVDQQLQYHCHLTENSRLVHRALEHLTPSDAPLASSALDEVRLILGLQSAEEERHYRILLLTDGASELGEIPEGLEVVRIGQTSDNVGISAADLQALPDGTGRLFLSLTSARDEHTEVEVVLTHLDTGVVAQLITVGVPAGQTKSAVITLDTVSEGFYSLQIDHQDQLLADNTALLGISLPPPIPVAVSLQDAYFYERCLQAFQTADNLLQQVSTEEAQVMILEGAIAGSAHPALVMTPQQSPDLAPMVGELLPPVVAEPVLPDHPLLRHLVPELLTFPGARVLEAPDQAVVIMRDVGGTPLLYTVRVQGQPVVVMNFSPAQQDFYLSPWFPVMVHNAARFLGQRDADLPAVTQVGQVVSVATAQDALHQRYYPLRSGEPVDSTLPGGERRLTALGGYQFSQPTRPDADQYVGAALLSRADSGSAAVPDVDGALPTLSSGFSLAWYLLVLGALLFLTEELLYHRRKVG